MSGSRPSTTTSRRTTRDRALLLTGFTVSTSGDWLYRLALPILVLEITGSAVSTAITYAIEYIPYLVLSMFAGVLADRFDRRQTLVIADLSSSVIMFALSVMVTIFNIHSLPLIYFGAFLVASVRPVYHPAFQGLIPQLTERELLIKTNAQIQSMDSILAFTGPVLGAGIIALFNPEVALWANAVSFSLSALAIWLIRSPRSRTVRQKVNLLADVREGLHYLRHDRVTLAGSVLMAGTNVGLYLIQANLIYLLTIANGYSKVVVGLVFGANGLGAVVGAALAPAIGRRFAAGHIISIAMLVAGTATVLLALPTGVAGFMLGWGAVGIATTVIVVTWFTLRQKVVPSELLGRVVATSRMLAYATIPLASVAGGAVLASQSFGAVSLIVISVIIQIAIAGLAWYSPLRTATTDSDSSVTVPTGAAGVDADDSPPTAART